MAAGKSKVGNLKGPAPWTSPSAWAANTVYVGSKAPASCVTIQGATYVCTADHTSGSTFDPSKWSLLIPASASGPRGAAVFTGNGAPSDAIVASAIAGYDSYIDLASGDTYTFS